MFSFLFPCFDFRFSVPCQIFFLQKNGKKKKKNGKSLLLTVFRFRFPMFIWRKKQLHGKQKRKVLSIVIFLLFIFPFFALWKTQNGRCCFFYGCGVSGFIVNVALFVSRNKEEHGKQKTENENGFRFCFLSQKNGKKKTKTSPAFPFLIHFSFSLVHMVKKTTKSRKLTAKTVSAVYFLFPFSFTVLRFSCRYKRKEQKNENGIRLPLSYFLFYVFNIRR